MSTGNNVNSVNGVKKSDPDLESRDSGAGAKVELAQVENQGKKAVLTSALEIDYPKSLKRRDSDLGPTVKNGTGSTPSGPVTQVTSSGQQPIVSSTIANIQQELDSGGQKRVSPLLRRVSSPTTTDTPQVDPHLVAMERYDPQSKAFSYVSVQALEDHFKSPKKPTKLVPLFEQVGGGGGVAYGPPSHPPRPRSTPLNILDNDLLDPNFYLTYTDQDAQQASEYANLYNNRLIQQQKNDVISGRISANGAPTNGVTDLDIEHYQPFGAKPKPSPDSRSTTPYGQGQGQCQGQGQGQGHYRTHPSWTDQINDPFVQEPARGHLYQQSTAAPPVPPKSQKSIGAPKYRDNVQPSPSVDGSFSKEPDQRHFDPYLAYYSRPTPKKPKPLIDYCQSPTPLSFISPPPNQAEREKTDWLDKQMQKLKIRQIMNDPEYRIRKEQEKQLLEELKHVHDERMSKSKKQESDYTVEGMGIKTVLDEPPGSELGLNDEISSLFSESRLSEDVFVQQQAQPRAQPMAPIGYPSLDYSARPPAKSLGASDYSPAHHPRTSSPSWSKSSEAPSDPYHHYQQQQQHHVTRGHQPYNQRRPTDFSPLQDLEDKYQPFTSIRSLHSISSPKSILKKPKSLDTQLPQSYNFINRFGSAPNKLLDRYPSETSPDDQFGHSKSFDEVDSFKYYKKPETPVPMQAASQTPLASRAQTPAFPVNLRSETPMPYHPLLYQRGPSDLSTGGAPSYCGGYGGGGYPPATPQPYPYNQQQRPFSPSTQYFCSRRSSMQSLLEPMEVVNQHPVFVKDTSKYWYKPTISRDEAINMLKEKPPGTFIIRDSNSFPGAFGLALKVAMPPPGVQTKSNDGSELVRHFLIEPTAKGVKLKGCNNEPVFGSLAALVYQHSITPLALPCKLLLPDYDPGLGADQLNRAQALLEQGAACNVTYLYSYDTESLTGPEAVRKTVDQAIVLSQQKQLQVANVHFKVAAQGITITDNTRKLFFRRHYPVSTVTFCGIDPDERRWNLVGDGIQPSRIFGFVAKKSANKNENTCHVFAEFEPEQPAAAIVNFVTKVMMASFRSNPSSTTTLNR